MKEVYLSIACLPDRLTKLEPLVESISKQTVKPTKVFFWVSPYYHRLGVSLVKESIPKWLLANNQIEVVFAEDYGPVTKVYPVLERVRNPEAIIVVADDDCLLPTRFVERLITLSHLDQGAVGYRGRNIVDGEYVSAYVLSRRGVTRTDLLTGVGGYAFKRKYLQAGFHRKYLPREVSARIASPFFYGDDILVNGHFAAQGVPRFVIRRPDAWPVKRSRVSCLSSLWERNRINLNNNFLVNHFSKAWEKTRDPARLRVHCFAEHNAGVSSFTKQTYGNKRLTVFGPQASSTGRAVEFVPRELAMTLQDQAMHWSRQERDGEAFCFWPDNASVEPDYLETIVNQILTEKVSCVVPASYWACCTETREMAYCNQPLWSASVALWQGIAGKANWSQTLETLKGGRYGLYRGRPLLQLRFPDRLTFLSFIRSYGCSRRGYGSKARKLQSGLSPTLRTWPLVFFDSALPA